MEKTTLVLYTILIVLFTSEPVYAENIAGSSAVIISSNINKEVNVKLQPNFASKKMAIKRIMEKYQSPMSDSIDSFLNTCQKYELNCYLLPSIAILESTFGRYIHPNSYNAFGWGGGYIMFSSWNEGIDTVGRGLRNNYLNKGAENIEQIGKIYSESPTWSPRIRLIQKMFEEEEAKNQLYLENVSVK